MTISISGSQTTLATDLKAQGLSASKVKLVEADLKKAVSRAASSVSKTATPEVRAALNQRISADVASGKLAQKDADAVNKTLDDMEQSDGSASSAAASSGQGSAAATSGGTASQGAAGGGGGGGGGSASKTEASRSVVVSGALETITITYTDGTTETETKASGTDASAKSGSTSTSTADQAASSYAKADKLPAGSLVDQLA